MINDFIDFLNKEQQLITTEAYPYLADNFLDIYTSKFIVLDLDYKQIGSGPSETTDALQTDLTHIYSKISFLHKILQTKSYDLVSILIRDKFIKTMHNDFNKIINIQNAQVFLYTTTSALHINKPFFPNNKYTSNKIDTVNKFSDIITIIDITADKGTKYLKSIHNLIDHIVTNNLDPNGNFILYFYFAPWVENHYEYFLEYFMNNFESVKIVFPSIILPLTNKCFFICQNKHNKPTNIKLTTEMKNKCVKFSKKIAHHNLNNISILFNLINYKMNSESAYTVFSNKISSHFNLLPLM